MARSIGRVEAVFGVAAFVLAMTTCAIWLFVPLHKSYTSCEATPPDQCPGIRVIFVSLMDGANSLDNLVRIDGIGSLLMLAFVVLTAVLAYGAYMHDIRDKRDGRSKVWGGSVLMLFLLWAMGIQVLVGKDARLELQVRGLGPGLCAGLAIITSLVAIAVEGERTWRRRRPA